MGFTFLPLVDLETPCAFPFLKNVCTKVTSSTVDAALHLLATNQHEWHLLVDDSVNLEQAVNLLNAGARRLFATQSLADALADIDNLDSNRIGVRNESEKSLSSPDSSQNKNVLLLENVQNSDFLISTLKKRNEDTPFLFVLVSAEASADDILQLCTAGAVPIMPQGQLQLDETSATSADVDVVTLLLSRATSDRPDGLYTTLVVDERQVALGLVYSNKESIRESLRLRRGVYQSRKRGLWYKGDVSGDIQELSYVDFDCDMDCIRFIVRQKGQGFCHQGTETCFGQYQGLPKLQKTLQNRKTSAPAGSYTARLFNDAPLLSAKIREEANELCEATEKEHIAAETADLLYFALTKCIASGVSLEDVERNLDRKSLMVKRRKGDSKPAFVTKNATATNGVGVEQSLSNEIPGKSTLDAAASNSTSATKTDSSMEQIKMQRYNSLSASAETIEKALQRPSQRSTDSIMNIVKPIIDDVHSNGDKAVLAYTHKFEKATSLTSAYLASPFPAELMQLPQKTVEAINTAYNNIRTFHAAQAESAPLKVETMPGVVCSRFSRAIERVGLYIPGGTAVLPSSALMLGIPAMVAGCKTIVLASPPRQDGSLTPEIVYIAHKIGAAGIVLAGGAQAIAAMAYGTESVAKVDKILGPGNQFVTAAKMLVSNDTTARVSIDMPAGPSEVLVVCDKTSNPTFVAADLLSQAEHGVDSQVVCIAIDLNTEQLEAIERELHNQASKLERRDIVTGAIAHSVTITVPDVETAMKYSNQYAPEHLILQNADLETAVQMVENAGSIFIGPWTPESVGDYSAGVNHSLPTYGYARQYSGVNLASFTKHITASRLTPGGLKNVAQSVRELARVEQLEAHRRAVEVRLEAMEETHA